MAFYNTTYYVNNGRIAGTVDDFKAVQQAIEKLLITEQYVYDIYNWEYGLGLKRLIGKPLDFIQARLPNILEKQLTMDDRVLSVGNFQYSKKGNKLYVDFDVTTIYNTSTYNITVDYI